jgi:hypothetical protein
MRRKRLYAHFGLVYYCSSVLEHGVANALCILELLKGRRGSNTREEWEVRVDKHFDDSFAKTLGRLKAQLARHQARSAALGNIMADLEKCVAERNFLAHHFWRDQASGWFTNKGRASMTERLAQARELFLETDKKLDAAIQPFADRFGLTADGERRMMERIKREAL